MTKEEKGWNFLFEAGIERLRCEYCEYDYIKDCHHKGCKIETEAEE